jgi:hypothetical protein
MKRKDAAGQDLQTVCSEEKKKNFYLTFIRHVMDYAWSIWLCTAKSIPL